MVTDQQSFTIHDARCITMPVKHVSRNRRLQQTKLLGLAQTLLKINYVYTQVILLTKKHCVVIIWGDQDGLDVILDIDGM